MRSAKGQPARGRLNHRARIGSTWDRLPACRARQDRLVQSLAAGLILLCATVSPSLAQAPPPRAIVYIGPLYPKRYASDNGIPGTGNYAYDHYRWPSLREAIAEYGLFGRKIRSPDQVGFWNTILRPVKPLPPASPLPEPPAQLLPPPRALP